MMNLLLLLSYLCLIVVSDYSVLCIVKVMLGLIFRIVKWLCMSCVRLLGVW